MHPAGSRPPLPTALLAVALLPILAAYAILLRLSIPIPLLDDFPSILGFANQFQQQPSAWQKLLYIAAAQHTEYKLLLMHTVVALQLATMHHVSLSFLIALGNLAPLLILFVLWTNASPRQPILSERLRLFLPVPFLLFQLNYAEAFDWAMGSIQALGVVAFALLSIHLLLRPGKGRLALAICAALLACSASAGGFLLAPLGLLALLLRRTLRAVVVWCLPFVAMAAVYAFHYTRVSGPPRAGVARMSLFFLSFLGAAYENMHHRPIPYLSVALGAAFCVVFAFALRARAHRTQPFFFFSILFVFGTAALATLGRAGMGLEASLSGRYKLYSDLLLILVYLVLAERTASPRQSGEPLPLSSRRLASLSLAVAALLFVSSALAGYSFLTKRRARLIAGMRQFQASPSTATPMLNPNETATPDLQGLQEDARAILARSIRLGLYRPPTLP